MSLQADIRVSIGSLRVQAEFAVASGAVLCLLGPNAAGKTTLLRALAGLTALDAGRVVLDGQVLEDTRADIRVPPELRPIGVVFQDYRLFPHLSALENVAFGLRARGMSRHLARQHATGWLARVGLAEQESSRPRALSGGQAQRVAFARALVTEPAMLLLDEPLAALDAGARAELRRELQRHLAGYQGTCLIVTHDPIEAMTLADQLVVLEEGRITQVGTPEVVGAHPRSRYVAELVGLNLFRGHASEGAITLPEGARIVAADMNGRQGDVFAVIHPRAVALYRDHPDGSPRNVWPGTPDALDIAGNTVRVHVRGSVPLVAEVTPAAVSALRLGDGGQVWATVKATEVLVYDA